MIIAAGPWWSFAYSSPSHYKDISLVVGGVTEGPEYVMHELSNICFQLDQISDMTIAMPVTMLTCQQAYIISVVREEVKH